MHAVLYPLIAAVAEPAAPAATGIHPEWWHWVGFGVFVVVMLVLDLAVFHRQTSEPTLRESAFWTAVWAGLALAFNGLVWHLGGSMAAVQFLTGYLIEWSLSMDNVFVFAVIFNYFRVPLMYQYRVLFWGILGAIVLRLLFVLAGGAMLHYFDWITLFFGAFLVFTGVKLAFHDERQINPDRSIFMRLGYRFFRVSKQDHGPRFFVRENGKLWVTPLFIVLLVIEGTDVLFAIDSVPAIFGVTSDPFIVFTSNIFAILGLRALYFLLAGVMDLFRYLNYGLAAVLTFVGAKMIAEYALPKFFGVDFHFFADYPWASLSVIVVLLGIAIVASIISQRREQRALQKAQSSI